MDRHLTLMVVQSSHRWRYKKKTEKQYQLFALYMQRIWASIKNITKIKDNSLFVNNMELWVVHFRKYERHSDLMLCSFRLCLCENLICYLHFICFSPSQSWCNLKDTKKEHNKVVEGFFLSKGIALPCSLVHNAIYTVNVNFPILHTLTTISVPLFRAPTKYPP